MNKETEALIKKLVGNTPIIMNVTITVDEPIVGAEPEGIFDKCNIKYTENYKRRWLNMQTIEIHTQGGLKHTVQTEVYDAEALNTKLNDNDLITVLFADFIIQRIGVKRIIPLSIPNMEGTKKVEVYTNGGKVIEITTNDYDPIFLNEQLNNSNAITVVIGDYIFSRIDVKQIVPVKESPVVEEGETTE